MNTFKISPQILEFENINEFLTHFEINKFDLLFTSRSTYEKYLNQKNLPCEVVFNNDFGVGEPTDEKVDKILEVISGKKFERIIAIGGGTIIDIAKLLVDENAKTTAELFDSERVFKKSRELIIVPTTCGTGSEVTNISILAFISRGVKLGLVKNELYPDYAVLIPQLLQSLPHNVFITSSVDALIHAVESFLSPKATHFTKMFSKEAIKLILQGYNAILEGGEQIRNKYIYDFLIASTYAGIAFGNAGCGPVHALSYPLSGTYHLSHGDANAQVFLSVIEFYIKNDNKAILGELLDFIGKVLEKEDAFESLKKLLKRLILKRDFYSIGVNKEKCLDFTKSVLETQTRLLNNAYVELNADDIYEIYLSILGNEVL